MGVTEKFATFALETTYDNLPETVVSGTKRILLESVAVMLLGSSLKLGKMIAEVSTKGVESPEAMLIGRSDKRSLRTAAFYNTAIADCNDSAGGYYQGIVHPGKNVAPASLTAASAKGKSGKDLILAMVLGIECYSRIDRVMATSHAARGFYDDGTVGTIGSVISVANLFGLDKGSFIGAIGNAALLAPCTLGGSNMFRSAARPLTMGMASANSILAVMMAQGGVLGPSEILECPGGFCHALADLTDLKGVTDNLGKTWETPMYYHKPFVGCRLTHLARQGAKALKMKHDIKPDDIIHVTVRQAKGTLQVMSHHARVGANAVEHSCSGPYLVANILMYDDAGPGVLTEERMNDLKVHQLADRIQIVEDPELTRKWVTEHSRGGRIEIEMKGGEKYSYFGEHIKGDPLDEWRMTDAELEEKLRSFAFGILDSKTVEDILEMTSHLEQVDNTAKLMSLLTTK